MPGFHSLLNGVAKLSPILILEMNILMATPARAQEDSMTHDKLSNLPGSILLKNRMSKCILIH